jgi:hypothetical protein
MDFDNQDNLQRNSTSDLISQDLSEHAIWNRFLNELAIDNMDTSLDLIEGDSNGVFNHQTPLADSTYLDGIMDSLLESAPQSPTNDPQPLARGISWLDNIDHEYDQGNMQYPQTISYANALGFNGPQLYPYRTPNPWLSSQSIYTPHLIQNAQLMQLPISRPYSPSIQNLLSNQHL